MAVDVTLSIPEDTMQLAQTVAHDASIPVEAVLLDWIHYPVPKPTISESDAQLEALAALNNTQLWTVVHRHLTATEEERLKNITDKREDGEHLSESEEADWDELTNLVDIYMLLRSEALVLLRQRGYDVARFFNPQWKYR